jgi:hypothetical protein
VRLVTEIGFVVPYCRHADPVLVRGPPAPAQGQPPPVTTGTWDERIHMTDFLRTTLHDGHRVAVAIVDGGWLEVDTASDLALDDDIVRGSKLRGWMSWPPASSPGQSEPPRRGGRR